MGLVSWLARNYRIIVICFGLTLLVSTPIVYWSIVKNKGEVKEVKEPSEIFFFKSYNTDNETFMKVWNKAKNFDEVTQWSQHGNYSVLICSHVYMCGGQPFYAEWFVVASTLEPNNEGLIYDLVLRLDFNKLTLIKTYIEVYSFNLTSIEDGTEVMKDFIVQDPDQYWVGFREENLHINYPFLILFHRPSDFGMTIILNLYTGKLMIAATGIWMGSGELLYPERISAGELLSHA